MSAQGPNFDLLALRGAFGLFATGVAVVTTQAGNTEPDTPTSTTIGMTVNSFVSVSLNPPLISWCLDKMSDLFFAFDGAENFTVNVLSATQKNISEQFSQSGSHSMMSIATCMGDAGGVLIEGALAQFECARIAQIPAGDHIIFVGEVKAFHRADNCEPLLFYRGGYKKIR